MQLQSAQAAAAGAPPGALEELQADQLEALALKAGDDLAHQAALHTIRLDHHVWGGGENENSSVKKCVGRMFRARCKAGAASEAAADLAAAWTFA